MKHGIGFVLSACLALAADTALPPMTPVPAGEFVMGDHHNFVDPAHPSDEVPLHRVWIDALLVGTYPVTNEQYVDFLNGALSAGEIEVRSGVVYRKGGTDPLCETRQMSDYSSIGWDGTRFSVADFRAKHPAVGIRWHGAAVYANWLSGQQSLTAAYDPKSWTCDLSASGYRLPTEAEWEYAARGGQVSPYRKFPWGDDADYTKANWPDSHDPWETGAMPWTTPVDFYDGKRKVKSDYNWPGAQDSYQTGNGANGFGLHDMSGNVWQWCNDWYNRDYYSVSPYRNPPGPDTASPMPDGKPWHVMRGGNWYNGDESDPGHGRVANRDPGYFRGPQDPNHPYYHVGFRVVRRAGAVRAVSAANYAEGTFAPGSIVALFGSGLAGSNVTVTDSAAAQRSAVLLAVTDGQINAVIPDGTATGPAIIDIRQNEAISSSVAVSIASVAPGLFSADGTGKGLAAAMAVRVGSDGVSSSAAVFRCDAAGCSAVPLDLSTGSVYLSLFGTGMRGGSGQAAATVGGIAVATAGPVAQSQFAGLDQLNVGPLPASLRGRGDTEIVVRVAGIEANPVRVNFQ